jgi:hypothetical protein
MKPAFALDLSQDALTLLYRLEDGWADLGRVGFDDPKLEARIADLRARAEALAPGGVATKLILPESQILYTEVDAPGPDAAGRRAQIAAALEGRTPYPVADLAFDWSRSAGRVQVAVVARVTLAEAEDFAETRGFNPVAFVARPAPGQFAGEPFFGPAAGAAAHLPEGARLDRDQDPVRIVALPPGLAAALGDTAAALGGIEPPAAETAPAGPDNFAEPDISAAGPAETLGDTAAALGRIEPPAAETAPEGPGDSAEPDISAAGPAAAPETDVDLVPPPAGPDAPAAMPMETVPVPEAITAAPGPELSPESTPDAAGEAVAEAPFIAVDDLVDDLPEGPAAMTADDGAAPGADRPQVPAFASRRSGGPAADPAALLAEATGRLHLLADEPAVVRPMPRPEPRLGPAADLAVTAPDIDVPQSGMAAEDAAEGLSRRKGPGRAALTALPEARHGTQAQLRARQGRQGVQGAAAPGALGAPSGQGRRAAAGRTRLGLVLVALLVLLMAAVALWSAWTGGDPEPEPQAALHVPEDTAPAVGADTAAAEAGTAAESGAPDTPATAEPAPDPAVPAPDPASPSDAEATPPAAAMPAPADPADAVTAALAEALASEVVPETATETRPESGPQAAETAAAPAVAPSVTSPVTPPAVAPTVTPPAVAPAATSPATPTVTPPAGTPPSETAPAEIAPPVWTGAPQAAASGAGDQASGQSSGAAVLAAATDAGRAELPEAPGTLAAGPAAAPTDAAPGLQPLPPPFGTVITFGPDGRIVATPEGVITPDGFTLFAGRPPTVPAAAPRPGVTVAAAAPAPASATTATATTGAAPALAPLPAPVDPAHAAKTPRLRPGAIVTRAAAARAAAPIPEPAAPAPAADSPVAPPAATPAATEGALPAPVDPAHAARGPQIRPEAVIRRAEAARAQAATVAAAAEAAARAEAEALANASRLAVASSRRPSERPSGLAKAVEAAVAAAVAAPPEPEPQPAAAPAPEPAVASAPAPAEIDEPEPTETVPNMPTTVTVARQATVKNAIDLGKINLIGVYGSSSNRRALVRMPNGRLVKVKIGDRLDGGQVAAIGDSELTYVKGGRSVTLKIMKNG